MTPRPPFDPDRMALVTLALATVLLFSLPLFAQEVPEIKAEVSPLGTTELHAAPSPNDRVPTFASIPASHQPPEEDAPHTDAPPLSIRIHTSVGMPTDAFAVLLDDIDRWQAVVPVSFVVRGLPVRASFRGLVATDHDRALPFVEPLARRNIALEVDPTVGRALDRACRDAFPDIPVSDGVTLPAVEVRINGIPLETHVGTVNFLAVLSRIARPVDSDAAAHAHAEALARVLADPAFALLKARVLETAS